MHMVCINTKYILDDGSLDGDYLENKDGVAVLGFLFKARRGTWRVSENGYHIFNYHFNALRFI